MAQGNQIMKDIIVFALSATIILCPTMIAAGQESADDAYLGRVLDAINQRSDSLDKRIDEVKSDIKDVKSELKDEIKASEERVNEKIDGIFGLWTWVFGFILLIVVNIISSILIEYIKNRLAKKKI